MKPKIVGNMIVGPMEEPYLAFTLDAVAECVDHFVVNNNGANVINRQRITESRFGKEGRLTYLESPFEDFAQARNACLDATPPREWEWLLRLDADEVHYSDRFEKLAYALGELPRDVEAVRVPFWHLLSWRVYQSYETCTQLFRWDPSRRWRKKVHESRLVTGRTEEFDAPFVHYSYTLPQVQVYDKWQRYSELEGDPEHYRTRGTVPEHVIEDRYQTAGAPFFQNHPEPVHEWLKQEMPRVDYHDVPLPLCVVIWSFSPETTSQLIANLRETQNPDYPMEFAIASENIAELARYEALFLVRDYSRSFAEFYTAMTHHLYEEGLFGEFGHFLFIHSCSEFKKQGWQKSLINSAYCIYDGIDAYRPKGAKQTVLVPRDRLQVPYEELRIYECRYGTTPFNEGACP